jgi:pimeloyl-ACP methyl ester carboxylesterase
MALSPPVGAAAAGATPADSARTPVLLLHGQPGSAADWRWVIARLGGAVRTIAIDRPGWDGVSPPRDLAGNAQAALAALDAHGVDRALVAGHSLGAAIAAWLAARHPERVSALVLAAPAANVASLYRIDRWLAAPVAGELAGAAALGGVGLALSVAPVRRRIGAVAALDDTYLRGARSAVLRRSAWRAYVSEQRTLVRDLPALEAWLPRITAPTTILAGTGDRVVPARAPLQLSRQIGGARLTVSERAGHLIPQRDPALVAEAILSALRA